MRLFLLLFVAYLLVLSALPCQDTVTPGGGVDTAGHANDPDSDHDDDCTPFCSCVCCGVLVDAPPPVLLKLEEHTLPPTGKTILAYSPTWNARSFSAGNWQPPRA